MSVVAVAGRARKVGKTSLITAIIQAMPQRQWIAIKITQCHHQAEACHCELLGASFAISEELEEGTDSDTARYLDAGAKRAFWLRTLPGGLREAMPLLNKLLSGGRQAGCDVILESSSFAQLKRPDLFICVAGKITSHKEKPGWMEAVSRADALILEGTHVTYPSTAPRFSMELDGTCSVALVAFLEHRLAGA